MRHHLRRRFAAAAPATPRTTDADLVTAMREISEETGGYAPRLLALIERRQPGVEAIDAARFVLAKWRADGEDRERLIATATRTPEEIAVERAIALEVQGLLKKHAGKAFSVERVKMIRRELVQFLRRKLPKTEIAVLAKAAHEAIDFRADRLVIRLDQVLPLLASRPPLAS